MGFDGQCLRAQSLRTTARGGGPHHWQCGHLMLPATPAADSTVVCSTLGFQTEHCGVPCCLLAVVARTGPSSVSARCLWQDGLSHACPSAVTEVGSQNYAVLLENRISGNISYEFPMGLDSMCSFC